jgi:hypothetical protein
LLKKGVLKRFKVISFSAKRMEGRDIEAINRDIHYLMVSLEGWWVMGPCEIMDVGKNMISP